MSGMFEPKDGDFASYIKNFNAKTIEKFSAKSDRARRSGVILEL